MGLAYATAGERGTPVLLIMGFLAPGGAWGEQIPALRVHHRVAWYDHRGLGRTESPPGVWTIGTFAGDAVRLMDHLGWDQAHVVGVSMGGMIAQQIALGHRDRLRSLTLITTHNGSPRARVPTAEGAMRFVLANATPKRRRLSHLMRLLFPPEHLAKTDVAELKRSLQASFGGRISRRTRLGHLSVVATHRAGRRLRRLTGLPTLIVKAGRDVLVPPRESDRLHRHIPGSTLLDLTESGHGCLSQCTEEVNAALLAHFEAADGAGPLR